MGLNLKAVLFGAVLRSMLKFMRRDLLMTLLLLAAILSTNFNHVAHQTDRVGKCYVCHEESANPANTFKPGKIKGFGKAWAHKNCVDCHSLYEGPTDCKGCHTILE